MALEPDRSAFLEFLEFLGRPGQVVKNTIAGRGESALRHVGQFGLDAVDGLLPGDWLPNDIARQEDDLSGRELIGADDDILGNVAGFGVDMALDPLTWVPGAVVAKGAKALGSAATKGAEKVVGKEAVEAAGRHLRSTFAAQRAPEPIRKVLDKGRAGKLDAQAAMMASKKALEGLDDRQLEIVGDAIDNFKWQDGKLVGELIPTSFDPIMGKRSGGLMERIAAHPGVLPGEAERLAAAAEEIVSVGRTMKGRKGIFSKADQDNLSDEYLMRSYEGLPENELVEQAAGAAKPTKERSLEGWREVAEFLGKKGNEKVKYERSALKRILSRSNTQGELAKRAEVGQGVMDLLRAGELALPDDLVAEAARSVSVKGPVPESGAFADVGRMLGGDPLDAAKIDPYGTELGKAAKSTSKEFGDVGQMLGGERIQAAVPGVQSGESVVGARTAKTIQDPTPEQMERGSAKLLGTPGTTPNLTADQLAKGRQHLIGDDFAYSNPEHKKVVNAAIQEVAKTDKEAARLLHDAFNGMPARGWLTSLFAKSNSVFKPYATAGYILPKLGFSVRNRLSGVWSTASNPEARGQTLKSLARAPKDIVAAIADGLGLKTGDRLGSVISAWDEALANSKGSPEAALAALEKAGHKDAAALIRAGGLDGFVRSEDLLKELGSQGALAKLHKKAKWPAKITKGVEDRMRLGLGMDLIAAGKSPDEAAKIVRDTLFDYDVASAQNRAFRDTIPFGQFMAKAVPQQSKFMAEKPWLAAGIGHALDTDPESPTPPWMDGKLAIPVGDNQYITGLGLPFEALNSLPNPSSSLNQFGRDIEKNVVGSMQPLAKTAFAAVSGEDPFFESPFGSYDKMPIIGSAGEAGRLYNVAMGTGLGAIADAPLRTVDKVVDDRKSPLLRAADLLAGINVTTVDPDVALQQRLNQALNNNPDVRKVSTPINIGGTDEVDAMLEEMRAVKARLKAKREAMKAADGAYFNAETGTTDVPIPAKYRDLLSDDDKREVAEHAAKIMQAKAKASSVL